MKKYCVQVVEVYRHDIFVEAQSPEQAKDIVYLGLGTEGELHYSHTLETDKWTVTEVK